MAPAAGAARGDEGRPLVAGGGGADGEVRGERETQGDQVQVGPWACAFTLMNSCFGSGILSMPFAFANLGLAFSPLLTVTIGLTEIFTLCILVHQGRRHNLTSYQQLVELKFGKLGSTFLTGVIVVYLFGSCVSYLIIVRDSYNTLARLYFPHSALAWNQNVVVPVISSLTVLPLSLNRSMASLSKVSIICPLSGIFLAVVVVSKSLGSLREHDWHLPEGHVGMQTNRETLMTLPVMIFAFQCHLQVTQICSELVENVPMFPRKWHLLKSSEQDEFLSEDRKTVHMRKHTKTMYAIVCVSIFMCMIPYLAVGFFGAASFPRELMMRHSNLLSGLYPAKDLDIDIAEFLMGCVAIVSYPVNFIVLREAVQELLFPGIDTAKTSKANHLGTSVALFAGSLLLALVLEQLGFVFELIGGTVGTCLIFVLPGLFILPEAPKRPLKRGKTIAGFTLVTVGISLIAMTLILQAIDMAT